MENLKNLASLSRSELENLLVEWGENKFRVTQLIRWIWREKESDFSKMTNLSLSLRRRLAEECKIEFPKVVVTQKSEDGTIKYLLQLEDGRTVETVWIPRVDQDRVTVCVSSQVGCKMGCTFCLTAQQKVERNLSAGEIAGQIRALPDFDKITNVVLMGMGEPLDNYDNLLGSLQLMTDVSGLGLGPRKITVSTSGLIPAMKKFAQATKARLAVSLNAPNNEIRSQIMPINRAYPIEDLLEASKEIAREERRKPGGTKYYITFEYILIKNLNDRVEHAKELVKRLHGIPCKVNLLLYNENPNVPYKRPDMAEVADFRKVLANAGVLNFIRTSRGRDISAACGQLVSEHKRERSGVVHHETWSAV